MGGRRRRGLADLIGEVGAAPQERQEEPPRRGAAVTEAPEEAREAGPGSGGEATARPAQESSREGATPAHSPRYLSLRRKEARLTDDQADSLASLARRMNQGKADKKGERITENTLIRVAVAWLLSQNEPIGASSEEEIRQRLGVPNTNS